MTLTAGREGGLQNLEVHGMVTLKITNDKFGRIKVAVRNSDTKGIQLQVWSVADFYFWFDSLVLIVRDIWQGWLETSIVMIKC